MWNGRPDSTNPEAKATPQFQLRILGSVAICVDGAPVSLRDTKAIAIIAYLCLKSEGIFLRSDLCTLLWPEKDPLRARASFR
jgi:DNA-binding SARP family transcriptional activator